MITDTKAAIQVVQDLVRIPSINPPGRESAVGEYIAEYCRARRLPVETQTVSDGRFNVIARLTGRREAPTLLISGHMDVVPVSESEWTRWEVDPFSGEIKDGFLWGRGSADMKGGLGTALAVFGALAESGVEPPGDVLLVATVDEEDLMRGVKTLVGHPALDDVAFAIVCEPTEMQIKIASKGRTWAEVTVEGRTAHASLKGAGINAIDKAWKLYASLKDHQLVHVPHPILGESFWQVTMIRGGIEPAIVPDACVLTVDARTVPGQTSEGVWQELQALLQQLAEADPTFRASVEVIERREPWETPRDHPFVAMMAEACRKSGHPVAYAGFFGTSDATVLRQRGILGAAFGPGATADVHKENEKVGLQDLERCVAIYEHILMRN
ncbi:MAG: M20 family metallopeptidase, partial [Firmicutes bacterium]|nr:M20 family metallopeptidase [Bacillota bacterium]